MIVIVGDTGSLGPSLVKIFLSAGYIVVGISRGELMPEEGGQYVHIRQDITQDPEGCLDQIVREYGVPHTLINNATTVVFKELAETTQEEFQSVLDTNVLVPFRLTKRFLHYAKKEGLISNMWSNRSIINISSATAEGEKIQRGEDRLGAYSVAKSALNTLTTVFSKEIYAYGVRVNGVAPTRFTGNSSLIRLITIRCLSLVKGRENGVTVHYSEFGN